MTLPQRTATVPTPDEIERAAGLAAEQLTNPKYVAGYLGGEMQALLRKFPDEPGIRACTALWVAHVRATVHGPVADHTANAAVLRHLRNHDDRPPAALRQEFPAELGEQPLPAPRGCDDCSVEPGETHRYAGCPGNLRAIERASRGAR